VPLKGPGVGFDLDLIEIEARLYSESPLVAPVPDAGETTRLVGTGKPLAYAASV
jgi:hypothetical protein